MKNEYRPYPVKIVDLQKESFDTKTFRIEFKDRQFTRSFTYKAGQFLQVSIPGRGEAPISISSSPYINNHLELTIRAAGKLTKALHQLKAGDTFYIRGPYGNCFPYDEIKGKNVYFFAGGIGLAPLRSIINMVFYKRKDFKNIKLFYGAKTPDELCFKSELQAWAKITDCQIQVTVDRPVKEWKGHIGVVTTLWNSQDLKPQNSIAFVCGPPIMIRFVCLKLLESNFNENDIYITIERYMKCGIGKCGHCNIGSKFVCMDGPVFTFKQISDFPLKENLF